MKYLIAFFLSSLFFPINSLARDLVYNSNNIYVSPGEPTEIHFRNKVEGGWSQERFNVEIEKKETSIIITPKENFSRNEHIIVRVINDKTYFIGIKLAKNKNQYDSYVNILDANTKKE